MTKISRQLTSQSQNNKGFIFTLDMILAIFIILLVLSVSHFFTAQSTEDKLALIQSASAVSDTIAYLDFNGTLKTRDKTLLSTTMNGILPSTFDTRIQITSSTNEMILDIGNEIPKGVFITAGKRYFQTDNGYAVARYWLWQKA